MYDWSNLAHFVVVRCTRFQLLLKGCTIEAYFLLYTLSPPTSFQLLLKGCTIEAKDAQGNVKTTTRFSCCWKDVRLKRWQAKHLSCPCPCFSCCWKDVRLKLTTDWIQPLSILCSFSCCWKDVRLKLRPANPLRYWRTGFSCCWKDVRLKPFHRREFFSSHSVSVVVERMYDWSVSRYWLPPAAMKFQLLLKGCTIEAISVQEFASLYNCFSCCWKDVRLKLRNQLIENKWFLTVGFWSVFRKWSICTKSAIIFENLGWFGWLLDCFW